MRYFTLCLLALLSCKTLKNSESHYSAKASKIVPALSNGSNEAYFTPNSQLLLKRDEFNNSYIEIVPGQATLFKYHYKRDQDPSTVDGHYEEILYFEIPNLHEALTLKNEDLQQVKLTFGRLCYCKGSSGYFRVTQGDLSFEPTAENLKITLNFEVENIPQELNSLVLIFDRISN